MTSPQGPDDLHVCGMPACKVVDGDKIVVLSSRSGEAARKNGRER